jgi:hypothetical protein
MVSWCGIAVSSLTPLLPSNRPVTYFNRTKTMSEGTKKQDNWDLQHHLKYLLEIFYGLAIASGIQLVASRILGDETWTLSLEAAFFVWAFLIALSVGVADWLNSYEGIQMGWQSPGKVVMDILFPLFLFSFFASAHNIVLFSIFLAAYTFLSWQYLRYCGEMENDLPSEEQERLKHARKGRDPLWRSSQSRLSRAIVFGILALLQLILWRCARSGIDLERCRNWATAISLAVISCYVVTAWRRLWIWLRFQLGARSTTPTA